MQIKVHVTLQELKDCYRANTKGLPKDAELVVEELNATAPMPWYTGSTTLHYHNEMPCYNNPCVWAGI